MRCADCILQQEIQILRRLSVRFHRVRITVRQVQWIQFPQVTDRACTITRRRGAERPRLDLRGELSPHGGHARRRVTVRPEGETCCPVE